LVREWQEQLLSCDVLVEQLKVQLALPQVSRLQGIYSKSFCWERGEEVGVIVAPVRLGFSAVYRRFNLVL